MGDNHVTDILNGQLPLYFRPVIEFQEILKAHGYALGQLETEMGRIRDNFYIATCDQRTIQYYEELLGITGSRGLSLEERRSIVLMKYGMKSLYTLPMLKETLGEAVGADHYSVECQPEKCKLMVRILNQDMGKVKEIYDMVALIRPAHVELSFYAWYRGKYPVPIRTAVSIRFLTSFYPRFNLAQLKLNGRWKLDGKKKLGGYDTGETIDLYPVTLHFHTEARQAVEEASRIHLLTRAGIPEGIRSGLGLRVRAAADCQTDTRQKVRIRTGAEEEVEVNSRLGIRTNVREEIQTRTGMAIRTTAGTTAESKERLRVRASAACTPGVGEIRIYNKNQLSSGWKLNGKRKLNGGMESR